MRWEGAFWRWREPWRVGSWWSASDWAEVHELKPIAVQQRALDELADTGALSLPENREDALNRPHAGAEVANRQTARGWRGVGLAGHVHDAAHALRDQVEAAAAGR